MKTDMTTTPVSVAAVSRSQSDSTKLASLLALAAGAVAMPQTGHADIIYTDLSANPERVGWGLGSGSAFELDIPGTARFGFQRFQTSVTTTSPFTTTFLLRFVTATDLFGTATVRIQRDQDGFAVPRTFGVPWNQGALALGYSAYVGFANTLSRNPNGGYDHMYLGFRFQDSTAGNQFRYGWIEVGLNIPFVNPVGTASGGPDVTIYGYAYDNTGTQPLMGQRPAVPEPSSAALMIIGALALGAPGLRKWRQSRETAGKS